VGQVKLIVTDRGGAEKEIGASDGDVLMEVLRDRVDFTLGVCGGVMSCGTCRVFVDPAWADRLAPVSGPEREMLDALGEEPGARLACQVKLSAALSGLRLTIAPSQ
jgi:ferredoxin, 2Fe-2S